MSAVQIMMPSKLVPVFSGTADTRGAYGGRGSGKTRTFAKMTAVRAHMWAAAGREGIVHCGRQFMNSLADSSMEEIKAAISEEDWLRPHFEFGEKYIRTACGRISYAFTGLDRNIDSIKSKARILLSWIDEAEPVTEEAWVKLIPTLRDEESELWVTWNPESKRSATHKRFREQTGARDKIVELNWRDNPWFPAILDRKRVDDLEKRPDSYQHIWEGDFIQQHEGAYFARQLAKARLDGRVCRVNPDPLMTIWAIWDIGGTGAKADATAIWIVQFVGKEVWLLDYYEAVGQPLATHINWLRDSEYDKAHCILPHDGAAHDRVYDATYEGALRQAGFNVRVIPNQGAGAAMQRVEAARRLFPQMWFDSERCAGGIEAIGWYHEKRDEKRTIGLGPNHDWSSHGADAFGLIAVARPIINPALNDNDDWEESDLRLSQDIGRFGH
jgi:phage terminase large subunit